MKTIEFWLKQNGAKIRLRYGEIDCTGRIKKIIIDKNWGKRFRIDFAIPKGTIEPESMIEKMQYNNDETAPWTFDSDEIEDYVQIIHETPSLVNETILAKNKKKITFKFAKI